MLSRHGRRRRRSAQVPLLERYPRALDLRFAQNKAFPAAPTITYTRASTATYFDSAGVLQTAASGDPRFGHVYDTTSGLWVSRGLHVEESRVWHALWNRDFTNGAWVKSNMSTAKDAAGLDNVAGSATTLTATDANATVLQTVTISSAAFATSFYVRRVTGSGDIDITDNNGSNWTTLTGLSSALWTRHSIARTQANPVFGIRIVTDTDAIQVDFCGLEPGSFMTSPNETTTATVTRAAEVPNIAISDIPGFSATEGTIYGEWLLPTAANSNARLWTLSDGGSNERITVFLSSNKKTRVFVADGGVTQVDGNGGDVWVDGDTKKTILAWKLNDFNLVQDGTSIVTDTGATLPTFNKLGIGIGNVNTLQTNGFIARLILWPSRLPDAYLEAVTA